MNGPTQLPAQLHLGRITFGVNRGLSPVYVRTIQLWLKQITKLGLLLMMGASMSACAGLGGASWREEALLHDGNKITVNRSQSYGGRHELGQPEPIKEHTISFKLPGSGRNLTWTSEFSEDVGYTNFTLLAVHVLNDVPYVIAEPNGCLSYNKWGRPNPPYVVFRYDGKEWQRIPLSELPLEFQTFNIAISMPWDIRRGPLYLGENNTLSAESISSRNANIRIPQNKSLLREPLAESTLCPDWGSQRYRSSKPPLPMKPATEK
jgi:hypothetical protein